MAILALDFGLKKIGLALGDEANQSATPLEVLPNKSVKGSIEQIHEICQNYEIRGIILGLPLNPQGEEGRMAKRAKYFANELGSVVNLPILFLDETLTSWVAKESIKASTLSTPQRIKLQKSGVDSHAAAALLDEFFRLQNQTKEDLFINNPNTINQEHSND